MNIIIERTELWYYGGSSDKVYNVTLSQNTKTMIFTVEAEYGRRGNNNLATSTKYTGGSRGSAWNKYTATVNSKKQKGYDVTDVNQGDLAQKVKSYKTAIYDLTANGIIQYSQRKQLEALLESGDPESINTAIQIIDVKQTKEVA